ncbi:MAG TPA: Gfo/Idh/MocA family oxidoreductase [Pirellulales bacterium]|jgi:predicted dehydrogenase
MSIKLRWGVLSTAKIGLDKVLPAMQAGRHSVVSAIASRDLAKAKEAAGQLGIAKAYGSYEELLADKEIDAVYNPLPNHLHVPWSIKCLEAGKHVLCEKPVGMNVAEAQQLAAAAKQYPRLKVMEAFMYRHHPQWQLVKKLIAEGQIGEVRAVQSWFSYHNVNPSNIRNMAEIGGGGLLDIGCYCISSSRFIFDAEPKRVVGTVEFDPNFKTDRLASAVLDFGAADTRSGRESFQRTATFICGTQMAPNQFVMVVGAEGRIEIEWPFTPPPDRPGKILLYRGGEAKELRIEAANQYTVQGDLFSLAALEDKPVPTPLDDALKNMQVIEAVAKSAGRNEWIEI